MGHTIPPKRQIVYGKLAQLEKFCYTLRQPYREKMIQLVHAAYFHVSALVYTNALNDEESVVYAMLVELVKQPGFIRAEKVRKCLAILLAEETP